MDNQGSLVCDVNIEWQTKQGTTHRKVSNKRSDLRILRGDGTNIFIGITANNQAPIKLSFDKDAQVHNKFMQEGKSSIRLPTQGVIVYISNAPPEKLRSFLKLIFIKMTNGKIPQKQVNTPIRAQLLKPAEYQEISPATNAETVKAIRKITGQSTPSPLTAKKRKIDRTSSDKAPAAKKLNLNSLQPEINAEQKEILNACLSGINVFFTGSAGTGKSYLLRKIIGALPPDVTVATASTGVAACHIGGITLHQFAGIGAGESTLERSIELASRQPAATIWRRCKHLIIDEISMVDAGYFEKIEEVARKIRRNDKPFGGIQLILCGDFFQLPPVTKAAKSTKFCFQTTAWTNCRLQIYELTQVHRQTDNKFITILNKIRLGKVDEDVAQTLKNTASQSIETDGILATRLCSHTKDADIINESKLKELSGMSKVFEAEDLVPGSTKTLDLQTSVPGRLELKVGAQVMLLKNINLSSGLVNGARGVVKEFKDGLPLVQFKNRKEYLAKREQWVVKTAHGASMTRKQVPLKLAWAFSIHKSQGLTLDCVEMSLSKVFEAGQAYVALSRAQNLDGLRVLDFKSNQVWANPSVLKFYKDLDNTRFIALGAANIKPKLIAKKKLGIRSKLMMNKPLMTIN